jgi:hypothetical protein
MNQTEPFPAKFARKPRSLERDTQENSSSARRTAHLAPEATPRPTSQNMVRAETTDDR